MSEEAKNATKNKKRVNKGTSSNRSQNERKAPNRSKNENQTTASSQKSQTIKNKSRSGVNRKKVLSDKSTNIADKAPKRVANVCRTTGETRIKVKLDIDGTGKRRIKTGVPFLDHMLDLFAKHGFFDLDLNAKGDIEVDNHHTNEDVGITLGDAFSKALKDKLGIKRYGFFYVPMDDVLVRVVLDISNRPYVCFDGFPELEKKYHAYSYADCEHFLRSFAQSAGLNLHVSLLAGKDRHHAIEAVFKGLAKAMDIATSIDGRSKSVPSTKGVL